MLPIAVIDAETDPFKRGRIPAPFIWGFYDGHTYEEFDDVDDLVEYLQNKPLIVYAHNGGKFDYHFLLDYLEPGENVRVINGRIAEFSIGDCTFRDSWNLIPVPLSQMQKDEIDYRIMEPEERDKPENRQKISAYLYGDCFYLYNWLIVFQEEYGQKLTLAGTALKIWSKRARIEPPTDPNGFLYSEFGKYYHGGRTQSFHFGEFHGNFELADINSAYPYAMLSAHPWGFNYEYGHSMDEWLALALEHRMASLVTVEGIARGCFPHRETRGKLQYPDDSEVRTYHITGWELDAALDTDAFQGHIVEFVYFAELIEFSDYINHFYELKKQSLKDSPEYLFSKLLMNSLYGKFASNPDEYEEYVVGEHWMLDETGHVDEWHFSGHLSEDLETCLLARPLPEESQRFYHVGVSASITGFVRAFMWRAMCRCSGVLYCDTDSIAAIDVSGLDYGNDLGQWDHEGHFDYGAFAGRKLYAMHKTGKPHAHNYDDKSTLDNWKIASKGVRLNAEQIIKVAQGEEIIHEPIAPTFSIHRGPHFIDRRVRMVR